MASEETIKQVLAMLSAEYPEHVNKLSAEQLRNLRDLYTMTLADIDDDDLRAAALRHVNESNWFPKISELRKAAARLANPAMLDPAEAWEQVVKAIPVYGRSIAGLGGPGIPPFADPLTAKVVRQFGWNNLCLSENPVADRARFIEAYSRQAQRTQERAALPAGLQDGALSGARQVDQITAGVVKMLAVAGGA